MDIFRQVAQVIGRILRVRPRAVADPAPPASLTTPRPVENDARAYGVAVVSANAEPGEWYWQAVRIHHLTPEENNGSHHLYLDVRDPALGDGSTPDGGRVFGARLRVSWEGGEQVLVVDKPLNEPGANLPMWRWQVCSVQVLGAPGDVLPSDRVTGLHTGHPDEAPGNTLFHHSFSITFVRVQAPTVIYTDSVIYGAIRNASGRTILLQQAGATIASQILAADESYRFTDLKAGEYTLALQGAEFRSDPIQVDGRSQAQVNLTLVLAESVISGRVRNGGGRTLRLLQGDAEIATATVPTDETYRFTGLAAGAYRVLITGTAVGSAVLVVDGVSIAEADLVAPAPDKPLAHYVLFGPADDPAALAHLRLAQDYLLTFKPTFGFNPAEAADAGLVTIVAGLDAVSSAVEAQLAAGGAPVQRIAGTVEEVAAQLAARIAAGQAF